MFAAVSAVLVTVGTLRYANALQTNSVSFNISNTVSSTVYDLKNVQEIRSLAQSVRVSGATVNNNNWTVRTTALAMLLALNKGQTITAITYNGRVISFTVSKVSYQDDHKQVALEYKGATAPEGQPKASR